MEQSSSRWTTLRRLWAWCWPRPVQTLICPWCQRAIPLVPATTRQPCAYGCLIGRYGSSLSMTNPKEEAS